jgi:hypothetical protein
MWSTQETQGTKSYGLSNCEHRQIIHFREQERQALERAKKTVEENRRAYIWKYHNLHRKITCEIVTWIELTCFEKYVK